MAEEFGNFRSGVMPESEIDVPDSQDEDLGDEDSARLLAAWTIGEAGLALAFSEVEVEGGEPVDVVEIPEEMADFNPEFFGITSRELSLAFQVDEDNERSEKLQELLSSDAAAATLERLTVSKIGIGAKARDLSKFDADDFEAGIVRNAFLLIKHYAQHYCRVKTSPEDRMKAVEWLFGLEPKAEYTLDLCCRVLEVRKDVLRLRLNYELWKNWLLYPYYFPFMCAPLPEMIRSEIYFTAGDAGVEISQEIWMKPGISTHELIVEASGYKTLGEIPEEVALKYQQALERLEEKYILSSNAENWYVTGRNPLEQMKAYAMEKGLTFARGHTQSWSRMFG